MTEVKDDKKKSIKKTTEQFIQEARQVHGDKYDYSKVVYNGNKKLITITCEKHGDFVQTPLYHLQGHGCAKCYHERRAKASLKSKEQFIEDARKIHGDKYDYSKVEYIGNKHPVCIICPIHGEFWMKPNKHLSAKQGCPKCSESHLEREIAKALSDINVGFVREKRFDWLVSKAKTPLDFYIDELNVAIECQGDQHFRCFENFGGETAFQKLKERDALKNKLCKEHGVKLLYYVSRNFSNKLPIYNNENTFKDIVKLLEEITAKK